MMKTTRPIAWLLALLAFATATYADEAGAPALHYYRPTPKGEHRVVEADVCVYGGSPAGVTAAIQTHRMGKKASFAIFGKHVGGLTSGGLTATDVGNVAGIGGMAKEFYERVGQLRGFKPSAAEKTFRAMLADAKVPIYELQRLVEVKKDGNRIVSLVMEDGHEFKAKVFVDATYEGDLFAKAGVSFHVGRESNAAYGETLNGIQHRNLHQFLAKVDPYKTQGDPKSGLLWGISSEPIGKNGDGDRSLQAYNFRMFLSNAADRTPFPKPAGYDASRYDLLARYIAAVPDAPQKFLFKAPYGPVQLHNGDCNNDGAFSTDYIGGNHGWADAGYAEREKTFQDHVNYQQGLMWFLGHDERVPEAMRKKLNFFGLAAGEFPETNGWPHQLYIREGRRLISDYVMSEKNCLSKVVAEDSVGLASYNMDSHNCRRVVVDGFVRNEGDVQVGCPKPYPVSYRSIVPKEKECANLFVPVCLSSTHIAYGSIRMEPVFMILGQSTGTAAVMAIEGNIAVQQVPYPRLRERLLADKQTLEFVGSPKKKS
jgi:hypothetical protein